MKPKIKKTCAKCHKEFWEKDDSHTNFPNHMCPQCFDKEFSKIWKGAGL